MVRCAAATGPRPPLRPRSWRGLQTLPRDVSYDPLNDVVLTLPVPELSALRTGLHAAASAHVAWPNREAQCSSRQRGGKTVRRRTRPLPSPAQRVLPNTAVTSGPRVRLGDGVCEGRPRHDAPRAGGRVPRDVLGARAAGHRLRLRVSPLLHASGMAPADTAHADTSATLLLIRQRPLLHAFDSIGDCRRWSDDDGSGVQAPVRREAVPHPATLHRCVRPWAARPPLRRLHRGPPGLRQGPYTLSLARVRVLWTAAGRRTEPSRSTGPHRVYARDLRV